MQISGRSIAAIVGGLTGALVAGNLTFWLFAALRSAPADSADFVAPIFSFALTTVSAIVGGVTGAIGTARLATGDRSGLRPLLFGGALTIAMPLVLYFGFYVMLPRMPGRTSPATSVERDVWRRQIGTPDQSAGLQLAFEIEGCSARRSLHLGAAGLVMGDCDRLALSRGDVEHASRYLSGDSGWRWIVSSAPPEDRAIVYIDEIVGADGPIFEVWSSGLLVRRDRQGAPARIVRTDLPAVGHYRACLLAAAAKARAAGSWSSDWTHLLDSPEARALDCDDLTATVEEPNSTGTQNVRISRRSTRDAVDLAYRPIRSASGGFELLVPSMNRRRFLLDHEGHWHVTTSMQFATALDPAPRLCEMDPSVDCDPVR